MFKSKNFILFFVLLAALFSEFVLTNIRYSNQDLMIEEYSFLKIGNLLTNGITLLLFVFIVMNMISRQNYRNSVLSVLLILAIIDVVILLFSYTLSNINYILILYIIYFVLKVYLFISFIILYFSSSKKLHLLNNMGYLLLFFAVMFSLTLYFIYNFKDDSENYKSGLKKADVGVILGAAVWGGNRPSPVLRERINKGFEVYQKKYVSKLILTGGGSPNELTEAEVSRNELIKYGIDPKNLFVEDKSNSTNEQIKFVRDKYYRKYNMKKIIVISDNFHLFRSKEICKFNNVNADAFSSDTPLSAESYINFCIKETFAVLIFWLFGVG